MIRKVNYLKVSILFGVVCMANFCNAQEMDSSAFKWKSNNVLKTDLMGYLKGSTFFSYERVLTKRASLLATYGQGKYAISGDRTKGNVVEKTGSYFPCTQKVNLNFFVGLEPRYYFSFKESKIPAGFHIGPSVSFSKGSELFTATDLPFREVTTEYKATSFLLTIGPQFLFKRVVAIDIAAGIGAEVIRGNETTVGVGFGSHGTSYVYEMASDFSYNRIAARFSVSVGIAFGK